jgi:medium-chain acyl-[acyl-carrier-protein] hydrolase
MNPNPKMIRTFRIPVMDADFTKKIKLSAILNYFQQIAGEHAESLGYGYQAMENNGHLAWVLVRIRVDMLRFPGFGEEILVETWPHNLEGLTFRRDFVIRDAKGVKLCAAVSSWVIIDTRKRQIQRAPRFSLEDFVPLTDQAIDCMLRKIRPQGVRREMYKLPIGVSHLDWNEHVNNARYADFIMDCFDLETHRVRKPSSFQIHYLSEAFAGDQITLARYDDPNGKGSVYVEGIQESSGKTFFVSQITF